jgi:magnesium-transporting ATPase (P-type)
VLCNDADVVPDSSSGWRVDGDPTEGALLAAAARGGVDAAAARAAYPAWPRYRSTPPRPG